MEFPDRVLIGGLNDTPLDRCALSVLVDIYKNWISRQRILTTNLWSAELSKLGKRMFVGVLPFRSLPSCFRIFVAFLHEIGNQDF